jgi:SfnB family sulfur acquisition oxidoreductase
MSSVSLTDPLLDAEAATGGVARAELRECPPLLLDGDQAIEVARAFAQSIADGTAERDRHGVSPHEEMAAFDNSGLLAITIPAVHGGPGLEPTTLAEVVRTIAAVDPAVAQIPQGHFLFVDVLRMLGTDVQQRRLFGEVLRGGRIGNALAERGASHAQDLQTKLSRDADGVLRLSGRKYYCTGVETARWVAVTAMDERDRLSVVFVKRDQEGVGVLDDWNVIGQRATASGSTVFDNVLVEPALVLPYWGAFEGPQLLGARAQLVHAAIEVGIAAGALADGREFLRTVARPFSEAARGGWAQTAAEDPHTLQRYGRLSTQVKAAEELLRSAARELAEIGIVPSDGDAAARGSLAVAKAKAFGSETAVHVASELFALSGASAADTRHDLDRHWRNARTHSIHDPVDWKYHHVAAYEVSGTLPPNHQQL